MVKSPGRLFDLPEIAEITLGTPIAGVLDGVVSNVTIDSRECGEGSLFAPLPGRNTDGHNYLKEACEKGSTLCFVSRRYGLEHLAEIRRFSEQFQTLFLEVGDVLESLQTLARHHMNKCTRVEVIGITGSNGKTATKEILGSILRNHTSAAVNEGNLNSEIGLPLAVFRVDPGDEYAIFEMAVDHSGEMELLADIVRPELAAVTNIGTAHIGIFGSLEGIAEEKRQIFKYFSDESTGFVFEEEPHFQLLEAGAERGRVIPYGATTTPGFEDSRDLGLEGMGIIWRGKEMRLPLIGSHNLNNALCALSIAQFLEIPEESIRRGVEAVRPLFGRGEVLHGRVTLIRDCYNANTESVIGAIDFVDSLSWTGRKILILGSMREMGDHEETEHRAVGERLARSAAEAIFLFGKELEAARAVFNPTEGRTIYWTESFEKLEEWVADYIRTDDLVLLKGSRAMKMERLTKLLLEGRTC